MIPEAGSPAEPDDPDQLELDAGQRDLEDRHALRRVAGLSTELQDVTEVEYRELRLERVVLMGVWTDGTLAMAENSLRELSRLAETAGSQVLDGLIQRRSRPDSATYVGAGKAAELAELVASTGADTVICDGELAASTDQFDLYISEPLRGLEGKNPVLVVKDLLAGAGEEIIGLADAKRSLEGLHRGAIPGTEKVAIDSAISDDRPF